ncbi:hypothetical protein Naga_100011g49 [Nannochloropsis gaditana]|uniref:Uncharacterized protein n=1 Tax=Nannochloropsis gaditana TaxID=72520 RepID=W7T661_9STRA|nr:hypothetical protein Naga_100011g49 [Nannochloropsis gaditana]
MHIAVHHEKERRSVRIILYNGWLRDWTYPRLWMKSLAIHLSHTQYCVLGEGGHGLVDIDVEIVGNTVPVQTADSGRYIKHLSDMVGPAGPDENTFFIGQSIGCLVILRYLACLPPGFKVCIYACGKKYCFIFPSGSYEYQLANHGT